MSQLPPSPPPYGYPPFGGSAVPPPVPSWPPAGPRRGHGTTVLAVVIVVLLLVATVVGVLLVRDRQVAEAPTSEVLTGAAPQPAPDPAPAPDPPPPPAPVDPALLSDRFGAAVWRVEANGCGMESVGTAFAVSDRLLITNEHVTAIDATPLVSSRDGGRVLPATVLGWTQDPDLAVLEVAEPLGPVLTWAPASELVEGQELLAIGYPVPAREFATTSTSILRFVSEQGVRRAILSTAPLVQGNSGGPGLTADGRVAGVVTELAGEEGAPLVPVLYTYEHLRDTIASIIATRPGAVPDCDALRARQDVAAGWFEQAVSRGDDPVLSQRWDRCAAGDGAACDELYWDAPDGSEQAAFGSTCGGLVAPTFGNCAPAR